jgi:hypothetical protein
MRALLITGGIGILSAAWTLTANAAAPGHGSGHGSHAHGGIPLPMRHHGGHAEHIGVPYPSQWDISPIIFPGEPEQGPAPPGMPTGGLVAGGPEHIVAGHPAGSALHPVAHVVVRVEQREAAISLSTTAGGAAAPAAAESDQAGTATAQPNPTANPSSPRPPGAAGPGRPVTGLPGPGRPGPGQPATAR